MQLLQVQQVVDQPALVARLHVCSGRDEHQGDVLWLFGDQLEEGAGE